MVISWCPNCYRIIALVLTILGWHGYCECSGEAPVIQILEVGGMK